MNSTAVKSAIVSSSIFLGIDVIASWMLSELFHISFLGCIAALLILQAIFEGKAALVTMLWQKWGHQQAVAWYQRNLRLISEKSGHHIDVRTLGVEFYLRDVRDDDEADPIARIRAAELLILRAQIRSNSWLPTPRGIRMINEAFERERYGRPLLSL